LNKQKKYFVQVFRQEKSLLAKLFIAATVGAHDGSAAKDDYK